MIELTMTCGDSCLVNKDKIKYIQFYNKELDGENYARIVFDNNDQILVKENTQDFKKIIGPKW